MKRIDLAPDCYLLEDFFNARECEELILWSEQRGYEEAKVQVYGKEMMVKGIRNNSRITYIDFDLAERVWERFKPHAVLEFGNSKAIGLNELFRFYRYEPGQYFKKHIDGSFVRGIGEASCFTFMVYLNDDFEGGETTFENFTVKPKQGTALVFHHPVKHAGEPILSGVKYALRTDVMYRLNE
ncbi:2OG-Fe(II) oxygenase [Fluviicola sp.]|uniref:prolyl hydroxylase family protein n=1 Tax=Fluviicola sp. TaxID=1917219 RepID=UPI0031E0B3D4